MRRPLAAFLLSTSSVRGGLPAGEGDTRAAPLGVGLAPPLAGAAGSAAPVRAASAWPAASSPASGPGGAARAALLALALLTTSVGVVMAAVAAAERSTGGLDRALLVAVAVVLALGAHLLPAWSRRLPAVWLLWLGCVLATLYGHAHFFAGAGERSGGQRAEGVAVPGHVTALQAELQGIQARAQAAVAADLAQQRGRAAQAQAVWARCDQASPGRCPLAEAALAGARARVQSLEVEQAQAARASQLRRELAEAAARLDAQRAEAAADPVDRVLAQVLGLPLARFHLAVSLGQAVLVELLAAALWMLVWPGRPAARLLVAAPGEQSAQQEPAPETSASPEAVPAPEPAARSVGMQASTCVPEPAPEVGGQAVGLATTCVHPPCSTAVSDTLAEAFPATEGVLDVRSGIERLPAVPAEASVASDDARPVSSGARHIPLQGLLFDDAWVPRPVGSSRGRGGRALLPAVAGRSWASA